jgi:hypothetical protein
MLPTISTPGPICYGQLIYNNYLLELLIQLSLVLPRTVLMEAQRVRQALHLMQREPII